MRHSCTGNLLPLILMGALLWAGCSDDGTAPEKEEPPPSNDLTHSWSVRFGDANEQHSYDIAVDASGNTIIAGSFWGTVDFGGGPLTSEGTDDFFVAKFGPGGTHLWSDRFGDAAQQELIYITTDASGNVIITGSFNGSVDFGGGALTSGGQTDIFVAKFGSDGAHLWSKRFGGTSPQSGYGVAVDASGNVIIVGRFYGAVDFGGGALASGGSDDIFVAKFDPDGNHMWSDNFGDASAQYATGVTVDGSGKVTIAGYLDGSADFGGGTLTSAGSVDIFMAQFNSDGAHLWSKRFGDSEFQYVININSDVSGNVILAGYFEGSVDFGGGSLASAGNNDAFVAKFNPGGTHLWSKQFGDGSEQAATSIAADGAGNIILAGDFTGSLNCGGDNLTSAGGTDVFVARFSSAGAHLWSASFGDAEEQGVSGCAALTGGAAVITGNFSGAVDFGGGTLTSAGSSDIFVARFAP